VLEAQQAQERYTLVKVVQRVSHHLVVLVQDNAVAATCVAAAAMLARPALDYVHLVHIAQASGFDEQYGCEQANCGAWVQAGKMPVHASTRATKSFMAVFAATMPQWILCVSSVAG
jgi:hypothetical protein